MKLWGRNLAGYGPMMVSAGLFAIGYAQEIAPDDPAIASNLGVWFQDAENLFDQDAGIWSDSSGNGNDASPVGMVNVGGPVTFLGPTLSTVSGGSFSGSDLPSVRFSSGVEDLLQIEDINGGAGLSNLTIFVVYNVEQAGGDASLCRPVGIGSVAAIQQNLGDNYNLGSDPSIRKDNGFVGAGAYSEVFPLQTTFIRSSRMSPAAIHEWFNSDGTLSQVFTTAGSSYTTGTDDFFMGDLRAGVAPVPGVNGTGISQSDFDVVQVIVYTDALSDEQVAGVNEWLANHPAGTANRRDPGLVITEISVNSDLLTTSLTWSSRLGRVYSVDKSTDLINWQEVDDAVDSRGDATSYVVVSPEPGEARLFFRVRENE